MSNATFKMEELRESTDGIEWPRSRPSASESGKAHGQTWMTVEGIRANIDGDGGVDRWHVTIEVAFKVDSELRALGA